MIKVRVNIFVLCYNSLDDNINAFDINYILSLIIFFLITASIQKKKLFVRQQRQFDKKNLLLIL